MIVQWSASTRQIYYAVSEFQTLKIESEQDGNQ